MSEQEATSKYEKTDPPRDIGVEASKHSKFKDLQDEEESPFYNAELRDIFMFTVGYGREKAGPVELEGDTKWMLSRPALTDEQEWVLKAVAVKHENDIGVLRDEKKVYQIAQKYANGSIDKLHSRVFGPDDDPLSELTLEVVQQHQNG
jgi:hypothetical protein